MAEVVLGVDFPQFIPHNTCFVGGNMQITEVCFLLNTDPVFVEHSWIPIATHASDTQTSNLVRAASRRHPEETSRSIITQRIATGAYQVLFREGRGSVSELVPKRQIDVTRVGLDQTFDRGRRLKGFLRFEQDENPASRSFRP